jgi:hypothetical protein
MVFQTDVRRGERAQIADAFNAGQPLTPLPVIFCAQVLAPQYFSQTKPDHPARNLFKTEILQDRSVIFFNPESDVTGERTVGLDENF